jgi:pimeloyl-ACP methyl ester carboxylesterase
MASPPPTNTLTTKTIRVSHLAGISVSYHLPKPIIGSKPTLILIPSILATASTLIKQVSDKTLLEQANLLVLEPLGHGATKVVAGEKSWTYWDSAVAFLQAMELLNVKRAFVLGVSQGGWIAVRMGLYAPEKVFETHPANKFKESKKKREFGLTE